MIDNLWVMLSLIGAYFLIVLGALVWSRLKTTGKILPNAEEFFLASRNLPLPVLLLTYMGSLFSAFTVVGIPGAVFTHGAVMVGALTSGALLKVILIFKFGESFRKYAAHHKLLSPTEILTHAYKSKWLGVLVAILTIFLLSPYLSLQLVGLGKLLQGLSGGQIGYVDGVGFVLAIVAIYVFIGGMRAVAYTDFIQGIAIFVGMFIAVGVFIYTFMGGFENLFNLLATHKPESLTLPGSSNIYTPPFFASMMVVMIGIFFQPHLLSRIMMCKNHKQIKILGTFILFSPFFAYLPGLLFGLGATILYPDLQESNLVMSEVLRNLSVVNITGLLAVSLLIMATLAASMSTADSLLIAIGQVFTRDIVHPFSKINRNKQVFLAKIMMMIVLLCAFFIGLNPPKVMIDLAINSIAAFGIFLPVYLGFQWHKRTLAGAYLSVIISGAAFTYLMSSGIKPWGYHSGVISLLISILIFVSAGFVFEKSTIKKTK